jgi:transcriptional regulator with XRE-family HTH domain
MADLDNPLGDFLRARRRLVDPAQLNLPDYGRRRAAGLRREELAFLAGVSSHYYARLEQGRDRHPSPPVLDALAAALQLDDDARRHLQRLAQAAPRRRRRVSRPEKVRPELVELINRWSEQAVTVVGRHRDVLAANPLAVALNPGFAVGRNLLRDAFLDPAAREVYVDWADVTRGAVAGVRATAGSELDDPHLTELIGELSLKSEEFRTMWARHDVQDKTGGTKRFRNPIVGEISLRYEAFAVAGAPGQSMYVFSAAPGSRDEQSLTLLAGTSRPRTAPSESGRASR